MQAVKRGNPTNPLRRRQLSSAAVERIQRRLAAGESPASIAKCEGVGARSVRRIAYGRHASQLKPNYARCPGCKGLVATAFPCVKCSLSTSS